MNAEDMSAPADKLVVTDELLSKHVMRKIMISTTLAKRAASEKNQTMFDNALATLCESLDFLDPSKDGFYSTVQRSVTAFFQYSSFNHMPIRYENVSGKHFIVWTCFDSAFNGLNRFSTMSKLDLLTWKRKFLKAAEETCPKDIKKTALTNIRKAISDLGGYSE